MDYLFLVSVFLHITAATILIGGAFFMRVLLHKYAARQGGLSDELRATLTKRWIHLMWNMILVLTLTGVFQMMYRMASWKNTDAHGIFGAKFIVFLAVVGVAVAITKAKPEKRPALVALNIGLGIAILFLSTWLARVV